MKILLIISISMILYSCSPINKQHGYLIDDFLMSSDSVSSFSAGKTSKSDIFKIMGSPSIEIFDVNDVWIYLISVKEKKVFDNDEILYQNIFRFKFNEHGKMIEKSILSQENFVNLEFSDEKTRVIRDAYGITDQLYDAFTRGQ